ncbi:unnamed protein product, partial [Oppiella nova]
MNYPAINECHIGFVGAGTMAYAMASGFVSSGAVKASQLSASAPSNRNLKKFEALGCHVTNNNNDLFSHLSAPMRHKTLKIIFLCVKPLVFKQPVLDMNAYAKEPAVLVVSVMAGINLETIVRRLEVDPADCTRNPDKGSVFVARIMPNTACAVNAGVCGVSYVTTGARDYSQRLKAFLSVLLTPLGVCEFVDEKQMDAVCGLSGSGIAFVYTLIHAMADGGLKMGLPRTVANNIAAQTVLGAALMVQKTGQNPIALRDDVASPGGTTIHGLHALAKGGFDAVVMDAVESATKRSQEFS